MEGEGRSEMEFTEIKTTSDSIDSSVIFHIVTDIIGFILFMHQQIPAVLQDVNNEYDDLQTEYKDLEMILAQTEMTAQLRRKHAGRKREVKHFIRRYDKLMKTVASLRSALQMMISQNSNVESVILVLGASPIRPQHVYEFCFKQCTVLSNGDDCDFTKTRLAEGLSRKAIRALISKGAGSDSYAGPTKLFLLAKAPSSLNLPQHFLPKRDFRYSKKIVPLKLRVKCRTECQEMNTSRFDTHASCSIDFMDSTSTDLIWFQCKHVIKGINFKTSSAEE